MYINTLLDFPLKLSTFIKLMWKRLLEGFGKAADKIVAEAKPMSLGKETQLQYQRALSQECEETHKGL